MGRGQQCGWGNSAVRGVGVILGVSSTSKNCPSHHKDKSPKRFELKGSKALNARWALPVYLFFEDEKSKASDEKPVKRKIAQKRPTGLI